MRTYPKIWTAAMIGLMVFAALLLFGPHVGDVTAETHPTTVVSKQDTPAQPQMRVVPAEVLGNGLPWAPLTGDSSN